MMTENSYYNWNAKSGDYYRKNLDYDKLYVKGKKREKLFRFLLWTGAAFITFSLFMKVLAYAATK